jgi:hypothetical protein
MHRNYANPLTKLRVKSLCMKTRVYQHKSDVSFISFSNNITEKARKHTSMQYKSKKKIDEIARCSQLRRNTA